MLAARDIDRFVDLDVRPELEAGGFGVFGHPAQILVEDLRVENQRRRGEILFYQGAEIAPGDPSFDFIEAEVGGPGGAGAQGREQRSG